MTLVTVEQGELRGQLCEKYVAFKGIPYAKPPVGKLRFKAPEPPDSWSGVRDATRHGPVCPQYNERQARLDEGCEDCLYLNVFTPMVEPLRGATPLPVMVWIHGGAFYTGSGDADFYGPDFLVADNVILVTFNYRLEVLGFLCLDNDEVPGNAGLKDQVLALQWVNRNIAAFGGDPGNITIFGCSAGSASVSYHMLSQLSAGLFHRAICQSGVCLNDWSHVPYARRRAFQLGEQLGKQTDDEKELLDFLRSVPAMSLVHITLPKTTIDLSDSILFGPVIEKTFPGSNPFICEPSIDILNDGLFAKVPLMIGYTSGEGIEVARFFSDMAEERNKHAELNVPRELKLKWTPEKINAVADLVKEFYFDGNPMTTEDMQSLVNLETDLHFSYNILRFAGLAARATTVYVYKLCCETERNHMKRAYNMSGVEGVCHADDLPYIFNIKSLAHTLDDDTRDIIKRITKLWTNFAKTGNPTPDAASVIWQPFEESNRNYVIIDKVFKPARDPDHERMMFWHNIYHNS